MYSPFTTLYVSELLENFAMNLRASSSIKAFGLAPLTELP